MSLTQAELAEKLPEIQPKLKRWLSEKVSDHDAAEDILQDTIVTAYAKIGELRDGAKLMAWLRAIAGNNVRRWLRDKRDHKWSELYEEYVQAGPDRRKTIAEELNGVVRSMGDTDLGEFAMAALAMRHCMNWSPREIAAYAGVKVGTVYATLSRARKQARRSGRALSRDKEAKIKVHMALGLWNAGVSPLRGADTINVLLAREAYALLKLTDLQQPGHPEVVAHLAMTAFTLALLKQWEVMQARPKRIRDWDRSLWDQRMLEEGRGHYRRFLSLNPPRALQLLTENYFLTFTPASFEEIDYQRIIGNYRECLSSNPQTQNHFQVVDLLVEFEGPASALKYLESVKNNTVMRDHRRTYQLLGNLYFQLGKWDLARRYLKKFLQWPSNDQVRTNTKKRIALCSGHLARASCPS